MYEPCSAPDILAALAAPALTISTHRY